MGDYQISWHSWKRQGTADQATCMPTGWWFTHMHQVEIIPLPSDFITLVFKELHACPITSETTLTSAATKTCNNALPT